MFLERTPATKSEEHRPQESENIDLDKEVTRDEIREAAKRIRSYWRRVGEILGPKPLFESHNLDGFEEKKDDRDRAQAMLDAWANKHHKKATRRCLIRAMKEEDHAADAAKIFSSNLAN